MAWFDSRTVYVSASLFGLPLLILCVILSLPLLAFATVTMYTTAWAVYLHMAQTDSEFNLPYNPTRILKVNKAVWGLILGWITDIPLIIPYLYWRYWTARHDFNKYVIRDVKYSDADPSCLLDYYLPEKYDSPVPIIFFVYGGSWSSGSKLLYTTLANTLRELGYLVIVPDYRKYPRVKVDAMYQDIRQAIQWTYTHASDLGGDVELINVMGHSAGAHLAAQVLLTDAVEKAKFVAELSSKRGVIVGDGSSSKHDPAMKTNAVETLGEYTTHQQHLVNGKPYQFLPQVEGLMLLAGVYSIEKHLGHETYRGVEKISAMARAMGSSVDKFRQNSPIELIKQHASLFASSEHIVEFLPRIIFFHGEKDTVVPLEQSVDMYNTFGEVLPPERRDEVDVRMRVYKRAGHAQCVTALMPNCLWQDDLRQPLLRDIREFVDVKH